MAKYEKVPKDEMKKEDTSVGIPENILIRYRELCKHFEKDRGYPCEDASVIASEMCNEEFHKTYDSSAYEAQCEEYLDEETPEEDATETVE